MAAKRRAREAADFDDDDSNRPSQLLHSPTPTSPESSVPPFPKRRPAQSQTTPSSSPTPALSSDASLEGASHAADEPPTRHQPSHHPSHHRYHRHSSHPHTPSQRARRPSPASSSSSATLVSAHSPPPYHKLDYRYMATSSANGLFKDYEPNSDDELPTQYPPRRDSRNKQQHRPLIDNVTNEWRKHVYDEEADDDDFLYSDKQTWYSPALVTFIAAQRIPRRIQRAILTISILVFAMFSSWRWFLGPYWTEQTSLNTALIGPQKYGYFGANARPAFTDMVQVKTLDPSLLPSSSADTQRLVVVGDVHGCKPELVQLLQKIDFRPAKDHLVLTGDIIAKGPDSPGVVDFARDVHASCVRGNHEDRILLTRKAMSIADADPSSSVEEDARVSNKDKKLARQFSKKQIEWLEQCPVILKVGQIKGMGEVVVAHAGLIPGVELDRQDPFQAMNMRTVDLETKVPSEGRDGTPWYKLWNYYMKYLPEEKRSTVLYGHDAKTGLMIKKYSKGLDSDCVKGGKLTALVIEADHHGGPAKQSFVHVKCSNYVSQDEDMKKKR